MKGSSGSKNFYKFIISYVSLSVIAGLFTYRLINSFLDNILLPSLNISVLPDYKFHKLTKIYNHKKQITHNKYSNVDEIFYIFKPGIFLKELIIWCSMMLLLFTFYKFTIY